MFDAQKPSLFSDQIDVSVNAPVAGTISEVFAEEEDTVTVGKDLFKIEEGEAPKGDFPLLQPARSSSSYTDDGAKKEEAAPAKDEAPAKAESQPAEPAKDDKPSKRKKQEEASSVKEKEQEPSRPEPKVSEDSKLPSPSSSKGSKPDPQQSKPAPQPAAAADKKLAKGETKSGEGNRTERRVSALFVLFRSYSFMSKSR